MYNQIKVEWYKLRTSRFVLFTIVGFLLIDAYTAFRIFFDRYNPGVTGQEALLSSFSDTSLLFLLSMFISFFIGNDFNNRTIGNEIRVGYTRLSVILSRVFVALPFATLLYLFYSVPYALTMGAMNGFGNQMGVSEVTIRTAVFFFQLLAVMSFTVLIMFWSKKSSSGMVLSICFTFVTCNLLRNFVNDNGIFRLTSFYRIMMNDGIMTTRDIQISFISAFVTILGALFATYLVFRKAELK